MILCITAVLLLAPFVQAPEQPAALTDLAVSPTLVADLGVEASEQLGDSEPEVLLFSGGQVYFRATSPSFGSEIWSSDGTALGTRLFADLRPGPLSSEPTAMAALPTGVLLTTANVAPELSLSPLGPIERARTLVGIDPETRVSFVLKDGLRFATGDGRPHIEIWKDNAWFFADDGETGFELWRSDGTPEGTQRVADLEPGSGGLYEGVGLALTQYAGVLSVGDRLVFHSSTSPQRVWSLAEPDQVPELLLEALPGGSFLNGFEVFTRVGDRCVFNIPVEGFGNELWFSDGTPAGTQILLDITPGPTSTTNPDFIGSNGELAWFEAATVEAGGELWVTDGTPEGTRLEEDIVPGPSSSGFLGQGFARPEGCYYVGTTGIGTPRELRFSAGDGTPTAVVYSTPPFSLGAISVPVDSEREVVFFVKDANRYEFFSTSGLPGDATLLLTFEPDAGGQVSGAASDPVSFPAGVFFAGSTTESGREPWLLDVDGRSAQILGNLFADPESVGSGPRQALNLGDQLLFTADAKVGTPSLWRSDGSREGTAELAELDGDAVPLGVVGDRALFLVFAPVLFGGEVNLWASDGTPEGTEKVELIEGLSPNGFFRGSAELGDRVVFGVSSAGSKLYSATGVVGETVLLADLAGTSGSFASIEVFQDKAWFPAEGEVFEGLELWSTDGTVEGTSLAFDIFAGIADSRPRELVVLGDRLYFSADSSGIGREVWSVTDSSELELLANINPILTSQDANPVGLRVAGGRLFFFADDGIRGSEPYAYDPKTDELVELGDLTPGPDSTETLDYAGAGDHWFFLQETVPERARLWRSAGTPESTRPLDGEVYVSSLPLTPLGSGSQVVFRNQTESSGWELWTANEGSSDILQVTELAEGALDAFSEFGIREVLDRQADQLLFAASDFIRGEELYRIPLVSLGAWSAELFGSPCGNVQIGFDGEAVLGASPSISLASPAEGQGFLYIGTTAGEAPLGAGCTAWVADPVPLATFPISTNGIGAVSVEIQSVPSLVGQLLYLQGAAVFGPSKAELTFGLSEGLELVIGR